MMKVSQAERMTTLNTWALSNNNSAKHTYSAINTSLSYLQPWPPSGSPILTHLHHTKIRQLKGALQGFYCDYITSENIMELKRKFGQEDYTFYGATKGTK